MIAPMLKRGDICPCCGQPIKTNNPDILALLTFIQVRRRMPSSEEIDKLLGGYDLDAPPGVWVRDGRIQRITEGALFRQYLGKDLDDVMSFPAYMDLMQSQGVEIIAEAPRAAKGDGHG